MDTPLVLIKFFSRGEGEPVTTRLWFYVPAVGERVTLEEITGTVVDVTWSDDGVEVRLKW